MNQVYRTFDGGFGAKLVFKSNTLANNQVKSRSKKNNITKGSDKRDYAKLNKELKQTIEPFDSSKLKSKLVATKQRL